MKQVTYTDYMRFFYLKDHPPAGGQAPGSVRVTLNQSGSVVGQDDYYPFGLHNLSRPAPNFRGPFGMPGRSNNSANRNDDQEGDLEIPNNRDKFYHAQARMPRPPAGGYDPAIGRFLGVDAMRSLYPGWSTYVYAMNNPVLLIDTTGNCPEDGSADYSEELYDDDGNPTYCEEAIVIDEYRYDQHEELPPINDYETESIVTVDGRDYLLYNLRWILLPETEYVEVWVNDGTGTTLQKIPREIFIRYYLYTAAGRERTNPLLAVGIDAGSAAIEGVATGTGGRPLLKMFGSPYFWMGAAATYSVTFNQGASEVSRNNREHDRRVRDQRSRSRRNWHGK